MKAARRLSSDRAYCAHLEGFFFSFPLSSPLLPFIWAAEPRPSVILPSHQITSSSARADLMIRLASSCTAVVAVVGVEGRVVVGKASGCQMELASDQVINIKQ